MKKNKTDPAAAKEYAFLLLKFRLRSEKELSSRLKNKKFSEEVIKQTVTFLKEKKFIDDSAFVKAWIESRLRQKQGLRKIRQELLLKGIDKELLEDSLSQAQESYSESDIVKEEALERLRRLKGIEPRLAQRRTYAYLIRRGFSPETIIDVLNSICKQTS